MRRSVSASLDLDVRGSADMVLAVASARGDGLAIDERLEVAVDGRALRVREVADGEGGRLHLLEAPAGRVTVRYEADVDGATAPAPPTDLERVVYLRPSRYCESDTLTPTARAEFAGLEGRALLDAVSSWVGDRLSYVPGSSRPIDGAVATLLARAGVCRDYAHLVIALLRALDVPARLAAVYAPGLDPMDFHAVAEAVVDDAWQVVDATALAPRQTLLRITTGRDAADTAFLTTNRGDVALAGMRVGATADVLPRDDVRELARLG